MPLYTIADPEGNSAYLDKILTLIAQHQIKMGKEKKIDTGARFISLGDLNDKGHGEGIIHDFFEAVGAKNIGGNRDTNNLRFVIELLDKGYTQQLMNFNRPPYWGKAPANYPRNYYREYLKKRNDVRSDGKTDLEIAQALDEEADKKLCEFYDEETPLEKAWIHSEFINRQTRGAPDRNKFRCQELGFLYNESHTKNDVKQIVVDSFIADMVTEAEYSRLLATGQVQTQPEQFPPHYKIGRTWNYLDKSVLLHQENGTLFCHSGIYADSYPFNQYGQIVPGCEEGSSYTPAQQLECWINARNLEYIILMRETRSAMVEGAIAGEQLFGGMPEAPLPIYNIALAGVPHALQSNDHSVKPPLTAAQSQFLLDAGVTTIIFGHQPTSCATPLIKKEHGLSKIATDTTQISTGSDTPQKRDGAIATSVTHDDGTTETFGRLNHAAMSAFYGPGIDVENPTIGFFVGQETDPCIGRKIPVNVSSAHTENYSQREYQITARMYDPTANQLGDYILVCYEKGPTGFLTVPAGYGMVRIPPDRLERIITYTPSEYEDSLVFRVEAFAELVERTTTLTTASALTTSSGSALFSSAESPTLKRKPEHTEEELASTEKRPGSPTRR